MNGAPRGWSIGTIRGVRIQLHLSLILLLIYVILVAGAQFPFVAARSGVDPATVRGTAPVWGVVFALSLLVSVLLHELGHVFVAQSLGTRVRSITLMMLGGVSEMERMPELRYGELKVAIVGPLVSLAIAGLLFLVKGWTGTPEAVVYCYWIGLANFTLAIFNLLPAFPTDGGRVLRSVLAARQGKLRGTRNAVKVSQVFAWIFGVWGFVEFNLLLILIAFFIYAAAKNEVFALLARSSLQGVRAGELARRIAPIPEELSLQLASEAMVRERCSVLPVNGARGGFGIVNAEQIRQVPRERWLTTRVSSVMWEAPRALDVDEPVGDALEHGLLGAAGGLPVLERGAIVGVLRKSDLAEWIEIRGLGPGAASGDRAA